jgi:hypothetical protein
VRNDVQDEVQNIDLGIRPSLLSAALSLRKSHFFAIPYQTGQLRFSRPNVLDMPCSSSIQNITKLKKMKDFPAVAARFWPRFRPAQALEKCPEIKAKGITISIFFLTRLYARM